MFKLENLNW